MDKQTSETVLECQNVVAGYGGAMVLNGISLKVQKGKISGIMGPNGAGKSTLLKALLGYIKLADGRVIMHGRDITALRPDQRIMGGLAYVAQTRSGFLTMTVRENLRLGAYLIRDRALIAQREAMVLERFPELKSRLNRPASDLSGGQLRMLEIGRFLMQGPSVVILDEPSIGLSPKLIDQVYGEVQQLAAEGLSFLIVEQNVKKIMAVADRVYALESGRNHSDGTPEELERADVMAQLYLGARKSPAETTQAGAS